MTANHPSPGHQLPLFVLQSFCVLGSLGLISSGLVRAELRPTATSPAVTAEAPVSRSAAALEDTVPAAAPVDSVIIPAPVAPAPVAPAPVVTEPPSAPAPAPMVDVPSRLPTANGSANGYNDVFIDTTDYSTGATRNPNSPSIVFSERSTGCEFTLQQGQRVTDSGCRPGTSATVATGSVSDGGAGAANGVVPGSSGRATTGGGLNFGGQGLTAGATTTASREYYNRLVRPLINRRDGSPRFVFPLSIPAPITSLFGWRTHPISGDQRFHAGTDVGAPTGTPIVATASGRVAVSDFLGGYGLTVILRHDNGTEESLYAHMSRLLVNVGDRVEQGEVIGLVGSTGNSTGPHLHFELRQLTGNGWVAVNTNDLIRSTLNQLVATLNNPLQAFRPDDLGDALEGAAGAEGSEAEAELDGLEFEGPVPFRPAQPNAS